MGKTNVKVKLNSAGVQALLKSAEINAAVTEQAERIANACGGAEAGYTTNTSDMGTRVVAEVEAESFEAMRDNHENNTLLRNIGGPYKQVKK